MAGGGACSASPEEGPVPPVPTRSPSPAADAQPTARYSLAPITFATAPDGSRSTADSGGVHMILHAPDAATKPSAWEGPLELRRGDAPSCKADVSLIRRVFIDSLSDVAVVLSYSGSRTFIDFIDTQTCQAKWPRVEAVTERVDVAGDHISIHPACEGSPARARCHAASVLLVSPDAAPAEQVDRSRKLTQTILNVEFTGMAWVAFPKTPQAKIVQ
jgi:hypothetical protein